jgi:hypothetical protein
MPELTYIEAREALPSAALTLPPGFLGGNAAALLQIVHELQRSLIVELKMIQSVTSLQLADPTEQTRTAVQEALRALQAYVDGRFYDSERTHCHNIDLVAASMVAPLSVPVAGGALLARDFAELLQPLRIADNDFLDELQPLAEQTLSALKAIAAHVQATTSDPSRLATAQQELSTFSADVEQRKRKAKALLSKMSETANKLIDRLLI